MTVAEREPDPRTDAVLREEIRRLYVDEELSIRAVAEQVKRSPTRVYELLADMGIERRASGRPPGTTFGQGRES
jgi:hypothetical protein